jgi:hypothetical protein
MFLLAVLQRYDGFFLQQQQKFWLHGKNNVQIENLNLLDQGWETF